jgi:hypothetical protein
MAALSWSQPEVSAGPPPPDVPDFQGEEFTAVVDDPRFTSQDVVEFTIPGEGWETIFDSNFDDPTWIDKWMNISVTNGYRFGTRGISNDLDDSSAAVGWAVGTSPSGSPPLDPAVDGYPDNVDAWLVAIDTRDLEDPDKNYFDFSEVLDAKLVFEYSFHADAGDEDVAGDKFGVGVSVNGGKFIGPVQDGGTGEWLEREVELGSYAGQSSVSIGFNFKSDNVPNSGQKLGLLLDNVKLYAEFPRKTHLRKTHLPFVADAIPPMPDDPCFPIQNQPPGDYFNEFSEPDSILCWKERRWTKDSVFSITHDSEEDNERKGILNMAISPDQKYVIVSPLVRAKPAPYNIEIDAKVRSERRDNDQYGIIFGANRAGGDCPADDFSSCFTNYYELRVRYRENDTRNWMQFKLKRIDDHDSNNQSLGPDLIDWTDVDEFVSEDSWVEWDVNVQSDGEITIKANDKTVGSADDTTYIDNPYFGLEVRTGDVDETEVRIDYMKID